MSASTLVATPDGEDPRDVFHVRFNRADRRAMGLHPSAQRGRVARGSYRRHPNGLFVVDGEAQKGEVK